MLCRIVKLVRALRKGWIKRSHERDQPKKEPETYLLWADHGMVTDRTATGLSYVPAPKPKLPGHEESYNPPKEYLPSEVCFLLCYEIHATLTLRHVQRHHM